MLQMPTCSFSLNLPASQISVSPGQQKGFICHPFGSLWPWGRCPKPPCTGESLCGSCKVASSFFFLLELEDPSGGSSAGPPPDSQCPEDTQVNKSILPGLGSAGPPGMGGSQGGMPRELHQQLFRGEKPSRARPSHPQSWEGRDSKGQAQPTA